MEMAILPGSRPQLYLEARAWLEIYVELVAESSPMKIEFYLPAGRNRYYFEQMAYERTCQGKVYCSLQVFLEMWRTELPFIFICGSVCKFVKCGCCEYLRMQIDLTPRSDAILMNALRTRLGQHFQFQSSQRLALGREEERCIQSGGDDVCFQHGQDGPTEMHPTVCLAFIEYTIVQGRRAVGGGNRWRPLPWSGQHGDDSSICLPRPFAWQQHASQRRSAQYT